MLCISQAGTLASRQLRRNFNLILTACPASLQASYSSRTKALHLRSERHSPLAKFHAEFLLVHPSVDGNGRGARSILMQQCLDPFGKADMAPMNKGAAHYSALKAADRDDFVPLIALIAPIVQK